jgi:subtilisin-like proprotein convertase family protein
MRTIRTPIRRPARASVAVIAALLFALAGPAHAGADNVVPNPGFEQAGCGDTPIICGWAGGPLMTRGFGHSGTGSMNLATQPCHGACNPSDSWISVGAWTAGPSFCAAIGPGTHPASFWAIGLVVSSLSAAFYAQPDCSDDLGLGGDWLQAWPADGDVVGNLVAPPGTRSARFFLGTSSYGAAYATFDDIDVENTVVADAIAPDTAIVCEPMLGRQSCDDIYTGGDVMQFYFDASEQSTFACSLDDGAYSACSPPVTYDGLHNGPHTFRVRAIDRVGNTDPTPAEQTWSTTTGLPAPFDFSVAVAPSSIDVEQGTNDTATIETTLTSGESQSVSLSASGQPAGMDVSFDPSSVTAGDSSTMTVHAGAATAPGTYPITISAAGDGVTRTATVAVTVTNSPTPTATPTSTPTSTPTATPTPTGCAATNGNDVPIPDLTTVESPLTIAGCAGSASANATVEVHIVHTYIGDLVVTLVAPDGSTYVLHNRAGGSADNIDQTYTVNVSSEPANGTWRLRVQDAAAADVGRIDSWTLNLAPAPTPTPTPGCTATNSTDVPIPDLTTVESPLTIAGCAGNASATATVEVHVVHTYIGDLVVTLVGPDGSTYVLHNRAGGSSDNIDRTYTVNLSSEPANGTWRLRVQDAAALDVGRIDSWTIAL